MAGIPSAMTGTGSIARCYFNCQPSLQGLVWHFDFSILRSVTVMPSGLSFPGRIIDIAVKVGRRTESNRQSLRFASTSHSFQSENISGVTQERIEDSPRYSECCVCIQRVSFDSLSKNEVGEFEMKAMTLMAALVVCSIASNAQAGLFGHFNSHSGCGCSVEPSCCAPVEPTCCAPVACEPTCCAPAACGSACEPTCCAPVCCDNGCGGCCDSGCGCGSSCFKMPKFKMPKLHMPKFKMPKIKLPKFGGCGGCGSSCGSSCCEPTCCAPAACEPTCCAPTCAAPCGGCN